MTATLDAPAPLLEDVDVREDGGPVEAPRPNGALAAGGRRHVVKRRPAPTALHALRAGSRSGLVKFQAQGELRFDEGWG